MSEEVLTCNIVYDHRCPERTLFAEISHASLFVIVAPRSEIEELIKFKESCFFGIYFLLGTKEDKETLYIGKAANLLSRLKTHLKSDEKSWFEKSVLITKKDNSFHDAHISYLEAELIERATDSVYNLENSNRPNKGNLSYAERKNCNALIDVLFKILPALRIDIFYRKEVLALANVSERKIKEENFKEQASKQEFIKEEVPVKEPVFIFKCRKGTITARMVVREDGDKIRYIVLKNSQAVTEENWVPSFKKRSIYDDLRQKNILIRDGAHCIFREDIEFPSPSSSASIILGREANGRIEWILENTQITLKQWQENKELPKEPSYKELFFIITRDKYGIVPFDVKARMRVENEKAFIILAGSQTLGRWHGEEKAAKSMENTYRHLKEEKIIQKEGNNYVFVKDYSCPSPSRAGKIVIGSTCGGWEAWKEEKSKLQLDHWRDEIKKL